MCVFVCVRGRMWVYVCLFTLSSFSMFQMYLLVFQTFQPTKVRGLRLQTRARSELQRSPVWRHKPPTTTASRESPAGPLWPSLS